LQLNRHRHGSLFCPASRFTHFACITLQGFAALNTFRFIPATFVSAACSPSAANNRLACWSLRAAGLSWFLCLPGWLQLIINGSHVKNKNTRQPLAVNSSCKAHSFLMLFFAPPLLHSQTARAHSVCNPFVPHSLHPLMPTLAQGCITCFFPPQLKTHKYRQFK
jgi:hypothetical protein